MVSYWSYWIHRIQELWNNYEELNERVTELEKRIEGGHISQGPMQRRVSNPQSTPSPSTPGSPSAQSSPQQGGAPSSSVAVVVATLRHLGRPATVDEINELLKRQGIDESLKETLLGRLKEAVQSGYVAYDPESKRFALAG